MPLYVDILEGDDLREDVGNYIFDHKCRLQRDVNLSKNPYNHPTAAQWANHLIDLPCHFWSFWPRREREQPEGAVIAQSYLLVPYTTDVTVKDRLVEVKDQYGVKIAGIFNIRAVVYRLGYLHLELEAVRSP